MNVNVATGPEKRTYVRTPVQVRPVLAPDLSGNYPDGAVLFPIKPQEFPC
jgi:hypothetical protein